MLRTFRRILLITLVVMVTLFTALVTLSYVYQDEVTGKLVAELNTHLKAPVEQQGISFTLIGRFPQASLRLHRVLMREVRTDSLPADTLLYAEDLFLEFGLFSLFRDDLSVDEVHGRNVCVKPGLDTRGVGNWSVWRADSTATTTGGFDLRKVTFDGLRAGYHDHRTALTVLAHSEQLTLKGRFREAGSTLNVQGDLALKQWSEAGVLRLGERGADVRLQLGFGAADGAFRIMKGSELVLDDNMGGRGDVPIAIDLTIEPSAKGKRMDLRANGFGMDLADVVALLPEQLHASMHHYDLSGEADVAIHFAGELDAEGPALSAGMKLRDGRMKESGSGTVFKDVRGELALELTPQGVVRKLVVKGLSASTSNGRISGDVDLNGLTNARLTAHLVGDIAVADLLRFARVDTLEEAIGRTMADVRITGKLRDVANIRPADLRALTITGTAGLKDATLKLKGVRHRLSGLNAQLVIAGNDATVNGLRCELQGNPIELSGTLHNLMPYLLFTDQRLVIDARGSSSRIDLAALVATAEVEDAGGTTARDYTVTFPALIDLDLRATVDELVFEDFTAERIVGTIALKDRVLSVSPMAFASAGGQVTGSLRLDGRSSAHYPLAIDADVRGMRIEQLFRQFRNFGQTFITDRHLKGSGNVRLALTASLSPALALDQNSLHCVADLRIDQGELNDHAPMIAVADHIRGNKLVSPFVDTQRLKERLTHVTFASLENQVEIRDRTIFVPTMLVKSSAMDIEVSAEQTFDGGVDDHFNFRLGDLFKVADGADEFGPVVDDGTGLRIFLHMYGTTEDLRFKNDGAAAAARRKTRIKQESTELKGLLTDILKGNGGGSDAQPARAIITVEDPAADSSSTAPVATTRKKGLGRLLEKAGKDEEVEVITIE
ncbi:MAG: hypothetical protein JNM91_14775 [Flavobacteriales bacterium]|nr:hypothetical protein [Flavobacteriales bacterium]